MGALLRSEGVPALREAHAPARGPRRRSRIQGLDGLRAVAVTAVVVYHLGTGAMPGGFLGVDLFFVISGFLITSLLLGEREVSGRIDLRRFYLRRTRRLLPALLVMLAGTFVLVATVARDAAAQFLRDLPAALVYLSNWWAIAQEQSYFELVGRGTVLAHLWSLAIEEQFYLLWPSVVIVVCAMATRQGRSMRRSVLVVAASLALASTLWLATVSMRSGYPDAGDPSRAYFGTDTHGMAVLVGAALAAVWRPLRARRSVPAGARRLIDVLGLVTGAAAVLLLLTVQEYSTWLYRGGFLPVALLFAVVILFVTHPASRVGAALDAAPLRWVGERSYGIYLWHWPVFLVLRPGQDLPWTGWGVEVARMAIVVVIAAASYRWVEVPVRQGRLEDWWRTRRRWQPVLGPSIWLPATRERRSVLVTGIAMAAAMVVSASTAPVTTNLDSLGSAASVDGTTDVSTDGAADATGSGSGVSFFGDSVALFAQDALEKELPGLALDAGLNRSPGFILNRVERASEQGRLREVVVLHLGNAGPVPAAGLDRTLELLADRDLVVLVNSNARFPYVPRANATLAAAADRRDNVVLADWAGAARGNDEWFVDALHLSETAKPRFTAFIREAIAQGP